MSTSHAEHASAAPPRVEEVSTGIYAYVQPDGSWFLNNTGFLVGRRGVVSIDTTSTERRTRAYLAAITRVSAQPVRTLINTHHHGDHTHGNCLLPTATIIGHPLCREEILRTGFPPPTGIWSAVEWGDLEPEAPFVTFDDHLTVWVDDLKVELHSVPTPAHTTNDIVAWIPDRSVLFTGDLVFVGGTPFVPMGSVSGSLRALDWLRSFNATTLVPGHGPVSPSSAIDDVADVPALRPGHRPARQSGRPRTPGARTPNRPRPLRPTHGHRTHRRQPAPRLRRTRGRGTRGTDRHPPSATGHGAYNDGQPLHCLA